MIEVRLVLHDAYERSLFGQLMDVIDAKRAEEEGQMQRAIVQQMQTAVPQAQAETLPADDADVVVGRIQPNPETGEVESFKRVEVSAVKYEDLEKVVLAFLHKNGVAATREKIAAFGYPKLDQVPAEKWGELKAIFEAAL